MGASGTYTDDGNLTQVTGYISHLKNCQAGDVRDAYRPEPDRIIGPLTDSFLNPIDKCPTGPTMQHSLDGSGTIAFFTALGLGTSVGISKPVKGIKGSQAYLSISLRAMVGFGGYAGAGVGVETSVGISDGPLKSSSYSRTNYLEGDAGLELSGGLSATFPEGGSVSSISQVAPKPRVGLGIFAGGGKQYTWTFATPQIGCVG